MNFMRDHGKELKVNANILVCSSKSLSFIVGFAETNLKMWNRFWQWYDSHITESLFLTAIIIYIQIPHMIWNADLYLELGIISHVHPVLDFFLYGVDLIEVIPMVNIGMLIYSRIRNGRKQQNT